MRIVNDRSTIQNIDESTIKTIRLSPKTSLKGTYYLNIKASHCHFITNSSKKYPFAAKKILFFFQKRSLSKENINHLMGYDDNFFDLFLIEPFLYR